MVKALSLFRRLLSDDDDGTVTIEKTVATIIEPVVRAPAVKPMVRGCPIWLEEKYRHFRPRYRMGLGYLETTLEAIKWSKEAGCYVALYTAQIFTRYGYAFENFVWGYIDGDMVELEQMGTSEPRAVDLRWLSTVTG